MNKMRYLLAYEIGLMKFTDDELEHELLRQHRLLTEIVDSPQRYSKTDLDLCADIIRLIHKEQGRREIP